MPRVVAILLIVTVFFVIAGKPAPEVNEAHYLGKAKHYWNPTWCAGDPFLESRDAHVVFYWTFGWLTRFLSLPATAWCGRLLTWLLLACSWVRLSEAVSPGKLRSVLSATLLATLVTWGNMAGEWLVGGVEAKGFAFAAVFAGLEALLRGRWTLACLWCGGAAAFHILVGGWSLVAIGLAWLLSPTAQRPPFVREFLPALGGALVLALPGLLPGLALTWGTDPAIVQTANRIYVFERLAHHLVFHRLPVAAVVRHAALVVFFLWLWRTRRRESPESLWSGPFPRFISGAMLIAAAGVVLDQSLLYARPLAASLLRYYWFRLADLAIPLGVTLGLLEWQQHGDSRHPARGASFLAGLILLASAEVGRVAWNNFQDPRPAALVQAFRAPELSREEKVAQWQAWQQMCAWIDTHTPPTALFLTPRAQQTFKWDAHRPEVVASKDIPQDAAGLVDWRKRMDDIFPNTVRFADLAAHGEQRLTELSQKYGFRYLVIDRHVSSAPLAFRRVYPPADGSGTVPRYEVYEMPAIP